MLKSEDEQWLAQRYPKLTTDTKGIAGIVEFRATYNPESGLFSVLESDFSDESGIFLGGQFEIRICPRKDTSFSRLPALYIANVDPVMDRHFGQKDKSACLCSPLKENEFLFPEFDFQKFFELLVIPFLYGQAFYSREGRWPWGEYAHGTTGLLESYFDGADSSRALEVLEYLSKDLQWPRVKSLLARNIAIKGHTPCFCSRADLIRRCHSKALRGLRQLQNDVSAQSIPLP